MHESKSIEKKAVDAPFGASRFPDVDIYAELGTYKAPLCDLE